MSEEINVGLENLLMAQNMLGQRPITPVSNCILADYLEETTREAAEHGTRFGYQIYRMALSVLDKNKDLLTDDALTIGFETYLLQQFIGDTTSLYSAVMSTAASVYPRDEVEKLFGDEATEDGIDILERCLEDEPILDNAILIGWENQITPLLLIKETE